VKISSESIKKKVEELGFQKVGIAKAEPIPKEKADLESWLIKGNHSTMEWMSERKNERGIFIRISQKPGLLFPLE